MAFDFSVILCGLSYNEAENDGGEHTAEESAPLVASGNQMEKGTVLVFPIHWVYAQ